MLALISSLVELKGLHIVGTITFEWVFAKKNIDIGKTDTEQNYV
jgi:hypothetical protein